MLLFYRLLSIRLSNQVQVLLMRLVITYQQDIVLSGNIKASELYYRMEKSFNSGLRSVDNLEEIKESYDMLKAFKTQLKARISAHKNQ